MTRAVLTAIAAVLSGVGLLGQPGRLAVPITVLHTFDAPPGLRYPRSLTPLADGGALVVSAADAYAPVRISRLRPDGSSTVLHVFDDDPTADVVDSVVEGANGTFIGVTATGGALGHGRVFRLGLDGTFVTLHSFQGGDSGYPRTVRRAPDGSVFVSVPDPFRVSAPPPSSHILILRSDGTVQPDAFVAPGPILAAAADGTAFGVTPSCVTCETRLFRRAPDGTVTTLYVFASQQYLSGANDLVVMPDGAVVGIGPYGANEACVLYRFRSSLDVLQSFPTSNCTARLHLDSVTGDAVGLATGTVFRVTATGNYVPVHQFQDTVERPLDVASMPGGTVWASVWDPSGTERCGAAGSVVEATSGGALRSIATFDVRNQDGAGPSGSLVLDQGGDLYGTTSFGGPLGGGTVFRLSRSGAFTRLYSFGCRGDGARPAGLVRTPDGALWGTTTGGFDGSGTVFRIGRSGNLTTLFVFRRPEESGQWPTALVAGPDGQLYGRTLLGGRFGFGTAFSVSPAGELTTFFHFGQVRESRIPGSGPMLWARDGNLYGIAAADCGFPCRRSTMFRLSTRGDFAAIYVTGGALGPLVEGADGRIYSANDGRLIAVTTGGVATMFGGPSADPQTLGSDGQVYGRTYDEEDGSGALFRMTSAGDRTLIRVVGASDFSPNVVVDGLDGFLYGTTEPGAPGRVGVVYRVPRPGPNAPRNFRIVR